MHATLLVLALAVGKGDGDLFQQPPLRVPPPPIEVGAITAEERQAAARKLVPLLRTVRRKAAGQVTAQPGTAGNSPFTGTPTTLIAITIGKQTVPVPTEVIQAMDRLIRWRIADPRATREAELFDEWLSQLSVMAAALGLQPGEPVACNTTCVVERLTTLDDLWGPDPRTRGDSRDAMLLGALASAVK
jgi:hypothetical protein